MAVKTGPFDALDYHSEVFDISRYASGAYRGDLHIPQQRINDFCRLTGDENPVHTQGGFVQGFYIDGIIASAFDHASKGRGLGMKRFEAKFRAPLKADQTAYFTFQPTGKKFLTGLYIFGPESRGNPAICKASCFFGPFEEPNGRAFDNCDSVEYIVSEEEAVSFAELLGGLRSPEEIMHLLALSMVSNAVIETLALSDNEMVAKARPAFEGGKVFYTSHSASFYRPSEAIAPGAGFRIAVDYSGLREMRKGSLEGVRGIISAACFTKDGKAFDSGMKIISTDGTNE